MPVRIEVDGEIKIVGRGAPRPRKKKAEAVAASAPVVVDVLSAESAEEATE